MAKNTDIRYIQFYTAGSAAQKIAPVAPVKTRTAPKVSRKKPVTLHIDPVAVFGILVSLVMLVCILVGMSSLEAAQAEVAKLENTVADLRVENAELEQLYEDGYDLDVIRTAALEMGMVPVSEVTHIALPDAQRNAQSVSLEQP